MNPFSQIELTERTLVSAFRTAIYATVAAALGIAHPSEAAPMLDGLVLGAVTADFLTWLMRSVVQLPEHLMNGAYDTVVNIAFACFFFHFAHFTIDDDGTSIMCAFVAFMLVLGAKIGYFGLQAVARMAHE